MHGQQNIKIFWDFELVSTTLRNVGNHLPVDTGFMSQENLNPPTEPTGILKKTVPSFLQYLLLS